VCRAAAQYNRQVTIAATAAEAKRVAKFVWEHPSNEGARTRAMLRATAFQIKGRVLHRRTLARLGQSSAIWVDLHRTSASRVVYANPPDHAEMLIWRRNLLPGELFVDVGSNVGNYAIWGAELGADVIALEPAMDTFALLEEEHRAEWVPDQGYSRRSWGSTGNCSVHQRSRLRESLGHQRRRRDRDGYARLHYRK
jgi:hypothetical protein